LKMIVIDGPQIGSRHTSVLPPHLRSASLDRKYAGIATVEDPLSLIKVSGAAGPIRYRKYFFWGSSNIAHNTPIYALTCLFGLIPAVRYRHRFGKLFTTIVKEFAH